jgi:hypothetical protein
MNSGGDTPVGVMPVVIAGDSREPAGNTGSYRRFQLSEIKLIGAGNAYKYRFDSDTVIESLNFSVSGGTPSIRLASPAQTAALNPTGWAGITSAGSVWRENPDGSTPPVSVQESAGTTGGTFAVVTPNVWSHPACFMPAGSSIQFYAPGGASTITIQMACYIRGGN